MNVFYVDDLCLLVPCAIALQELLNRCHSYSITVDVKFNASKSFCIALFIYFIVIIHKRYKKVCMNIYKDNIVTVII